MTWVSILLFQISHQHLFIQETYPMDPTICQVQTRHPVSWIYRPESQEFPSLLRSRLARPWPIHTTSDS